MPEELTENTETTHANNLRVTIQANVGQIVCDWDVGYVDGPDFVATGRRQYIFVGAEFDALAAGEDFETGVSNYTNIRNVIYAALKAAGVL